MMGRSLLSHAGKNNKADTMPQPIVNRNVFGIRESIAIPPKVLKQHAFKMPNAVGKIWDAAFSKVQQKDGFAEFAQHTLEASKDHDPKITAVILKAWNAVGIYPEVPSDSNFSYNTTLITAFVSGAILGGLGLALKAYVGYLD